MEVILLRALCFCRYDLNDVSVEEIVDANDFGALFGDACCPDCYCLGVIDIELLSFPGSVDVVIGVVVKIDALGEVEPTCSFSSHV